MNYHAVADKIIVTLGIGGESPHPLRDRIAEIVATAAAPAEPVAITDEMVDAAHSYYFMQLAGDVLNSASSIEAWKGCMRKALEAALATERRAREIAAGGGT
jgi:hypothetical protein